MARRNKTAAKESEPQQPRVVQIKVPLSDMPGELLEAWGNDSGRVKKPSEILAYSSEIARRNEAYFQGRRNAQGVEEMQHIQEIVAHARHALETKNIDEALRLFYALGLVAGPRQAKQEVAASGGAERQNDAKFEVWRRDAEDLRGKTPGISNHQLARAIHNRHKGGIYEGPKETIRRNI